MPAEQAADQVVAVINRSALVSSSRRSAIGAWRPRPPPTYFLVGGKALYYWAVGVVQKVFGWPVNGMIAKAFKLSGRHV
jgi:hypothetical protein